MRNCRTHFKYRMEDVRSNGRGHLFSCQLHAKLIFSFYMSTTEDYCDESECNFAFCVTTVSFHSFLRDHKMGAEKRLFIAWSKKRVAIREESRKKKKKKGNKNFLICSFLSRQTTTLGAGCSSHSLTLSLSLTHIYSEEDLE